MNKSNFLNNKLLDKSNIALLAIIGMMAGFLVSRFALSVSMLVLGITALWGVNPKQWLKQKWWLIGFCWVLCYVITYFWSADKAAWMERGQVKLPILLLPLSFAFLPSFSISQLRVLTVALAIMFLAGACYSVSFFINDPVFYIKQYGLSHVLPTPAKKDYIRFSLSITLFIVWCVYFWPQLGSRALKWFIGCTVALLGIYQHILSSKSGLLALYLFIIAWCIYIIIAKKKIIGLVIALLLAATFFFALRYIPTFHERFYYTKITEFERGDASGGYGDIGRLVSYDIGIKLIKEHPLTGVGTGDMLAEMGKGYDKWYPQVGSEFRLLPHDQFLAVALGCGIPAAILFAIWVFMPLAWIKKNREGFFFFIAWLILFFQLLIEPVLEIQFGVFVYLFFLLLYRHVLLPGSYTRVGLKQEQKITR